MYKVEDFVIALYCLIEDELYPHFCHHYGRPRRSGFSPSLSDSECLTIEVVGHLETALRADARPMGGVVSRAPRSRGLCPAQRQLVAGQSLDAPPHRPAFRRASSAHPGD